MFGHKAVSLPLLIWRVRQDGWGRGCGEGPPASLCPGMCPGHGLVTGCLGGQGLYRSLWPALGLGNIPGRCPPSIPPDSAYFSLSLISDS